MFAGLIGCDRIKSVEVTRPEGSTGCRQRDGAHPRRIAFKPAQTLKSSVVFAINRKQMRAGRVSFIEQQTARGNQGLLIGQQYRLARANRSPGRGQSGKSGNTRYHHINLRQGFRSFF